MSKTAKRYPKQRKPVIILVCEGKNKTERTYFNHFVKRDAAYSLIIKDSESTDIGSMANKADQLSREYQLDKSLNDRIFCIVDLDLDRTKLDKLNKAKKKYKNVEFIVSNPCFEIWFFYHFISDPKVLSSSQKVKEELSKHINNYKENMDVFRIFNFEEKYGIAINNSEKKNALYDTDASLVDKNPYTEVQNIIFLLKSFENN